MPLSIVSFKWLVKFTYIVGYRKFFFFDNLISSYYRSSYHIFVTVCFDDGGEIWVGCMHDIKNMCAFELDPLQKCESIECQCDDTHECKWSGSGDTPDFGRKVLVFQFHKKFWNRFKIVSGFWKCVRCQEELGFFFDDIESDISCEWVDIKNCRHRCIV